MQNAIKARRRRHKKDKTIPSDSTKLTTKNLLEQKSKFELNAFQHVLGNTRILASPRNEFRLLQKRILKVCKINSETFKPVFEELIT